MTRDPLTNTPAQAGYYMPAEWERHEATWLAWPHDPLTFPDRVEKVEKTYAEMIQALLPSENIHLLVKNTAMEDRARRLIKDAAKERKGASGTVIFHHHDYADVWFRDYGPLFLRNRKDGSLAMTHWIYNAWGGKYEALIKDTQIPWMIQEMLKIPYFTPGIVLEGGSIDVNGQGTLLTTEQCLLNKNRNPDLSRQEIEDTLQDFLGVKQIIWLKNGIAGDDTDGHIDDIARFVAPTTVLCVYEEDRSDVNYPILHENYSILQNVKDQDGNRLNVVKLPTPGIVHDRVKQQTDSTNRTAPGRDQVQILDFLNHNEQQDAGSMGEDAGRLPASYANFYIGNAVVLVPVFGHANDKKALEIIQRHFPNRQAVGIDATDLVHGLGTFHCISQQQPARSY